MPVFVGPSDDPFNQIGFIRLNHDGRIEAFNTSKTLCDMFADQNTACDAILFDRLSVRPRSNSGAIRGEPLTTGVSEEPEPQPEPTQEDDVSQALPAAFLEKLRPGGPWLPAAIMPEGGTPTVITARTAADVDAFIATHNGTRNLYYSVNPTRTAMRKKAEKTDIAAIEYVLADLDPATGETSEAAKARYLTQLNGTFEPKPTAAIDSGNGIQGLWKLKERIVLGEPIRNTKGKLEFAPEDQAKIADVEACSAELMRQLGAKAGTQNIDRILRLPGTTNLPNAKKRKEGRVTCQATLLWFNDTSYPLDAFPLSKGNGAAKTPKFEIPDALKHLGLDNGLGAGIGPPRDDTGSGHGFRFMRDSCHAKGMSYQEARAAILADKNEAGEWANRVDERQLERAFKRSKSDAVDIGAKAGVLDLDPAPPVPQGVTTADFRAYLPDHTYIFTPTGTFWSKEGVNAGLKPVLIGFTKGEPKTMAANKWLDRNQPVHHLTWAPGHPMLIKNQLVIDDEWVERNGVTTFNLYRPPTLKHGDPSKAGPWLELTHKVYPDDADRLILKLAHQVQRPGEKINHATVMGGPPGIGKDTILEPVRRAVGAWNWKETSPQQILGRFNGFLQSVVMRINEVRDLGEFNRYQFYEHTKPFFAAPPKTLRVDEKNIPEHDVMNVTFAILTTNRTSGIFLPPDDRRHDVMWSKLTKHDFTESYWIKMWKWYDEGGDGHVAAYLATLDISTFNPKAPPPQTEAFWTIVNANRAPEEGELQDLLDKLDNPDAVTINQIVKTASDPKHLDIKNWLLDRRNRPSIPHRFDAVGYVSVHNEAAASNLWVVAGARQAVYAKKDLLPRDRLAAVTALQREADREAATAPQRKAGKTAKADGKGQPTATPDTPPQKTDLDREVVDLLNRPKK